MLVIACNRVTVSRCLDNLITYRPSPDTPIIVSQDCGDEPTAVVIRSYEGRGVTHIKQPDLSEPVVKTKRGNTVGYTKVSRCVA